MRDYCRLYRLRPRHPGTRQATGPATGDGGAWRRPEDETIRLFLLAALREDDQASACLKATAAYARLPWPAGVIVDRRV